MLLGCGVSVIALACVDAARRNAVSPIAATHRRDAGPREHPHDAPLRERARDRQTLLVHSEYACAVVPEGVRCWGRLPTDVAPAAFGESAERLRTVFSGEVSEIASGQTGLCVLDRGRRVHCRFAGDHDWRIVAEDAIRLVGATYGPWIVGRAGVSLVTQHEGALALAAPVHEWSAALSAGDALCVLQGARARCIARDAPENRLIEVAPARAAAIAARVDGGVCAGAMLDRCDLAPSDFRLSRDRYSSAGARQLDQARALGPASRVAVAEDWACRLGGDSVLRCEVGRDRSRAELADVIDVASSPEMTCARQRSGSVSCLAKLGLGRPDGRQCVEGNERVRIDGRFRAVVALGWGFCALPEAASSIVCWGRSQIDSGDVVWPPREIALPQRARTIREWGAVLEDGSWMNFARLLVLAIRDEPPAAARADERVMLGRWRCRLDASGVRCRSVEGTGAPSAWAARFSSQIVQSTVGRSHICAALRDGRVECLDTSSRRVVGVGRGADPQLDLTDQLCVRGTDGVRCEQLPLARSTNTLRNRISGSSSESRFALGYGTLCFADPQQSVHCASVAGAEARSIRTPLVAPAQLAVGLRSVCSLDAQGALSCWGADGDCAGGASASASAGVGFVPVF